jgi:hypothetical protein
MSFGEDQSAHAQPELAPKLFDEIRKTLNSYKKFWRTRRAVLNGEQLYTLSSTDLETRGFMGPWTFNTTQSAIAAFAASGFSAILLHLLFPGLDSSTPPPSSKTVRDGIVWFGKIFPLLKTGILPFTLLASARLIAWSSFHRGDRTPQTMARNTYAYLYTDGAYGLFPQFLGAVMTTFILSDSKAGTDYMVAGYGVLEIVFRAIIVWQFVLIIRIYREELFSLNGYNVGGDDVAIVADHRTENGKKGPRLQFFLTTLLGAPLVSVAILGVAFVAGVILSVIFALLMKADHF